MKQISIYLENANLSPASYYRLTQYFQELPDTRIHSSLTDWIYLFWHRQSKYGRIVFAIPLYIIYFFRTLWFLIKDLRGITNGIIIISRVLIPHKMLGLHKMLLTRLSKKNTIIWDYDDNIIESGSTCRSDFDYLSKACHYIVVTSPFLRDLVKVPYRDKVLLLPTTDGDMIETQYSQIGQQRKDLYNNEIRLVWVATSSGLIHLNIIIKALDDAARILKEKYKKELQLRIVCNKEATYTCHHLQMINIPWTRERAKSELKFAHIGIMPLIDNDFTRGKGGFKLVQYLSVYLPVIASAVGFNKEIITHDCGYLIDDQRQAEERWKDAILSLSTNWENYEVMCHSARQRYDECFSYEKNKAFWLNLCQRMP